MGADKPACRRVYSGSSGSRRALRRALVWAAEVAERIKQTGPGPRVLPAPPLMHGTGLLTAFFAMLLGHAHQGMFGDPYYGGNANFAGWDLLGYPGVRTMVTTADQQALESRQLKANHRSAYDYDTFTKASHGD